jgi:hypothetical protein
VLIALPAAIVIAERSEPLSLRHRLSEAISGVAGAPRRRPGSGHEPA